jgi:hypothetical protein
MPPLLCLRNCAPETLHQEDPLMRRSILTVTFLCVGTLASSPCSAVDGEKVGFKRIAIDTTFRSEGVAAADVNRDGKIDVIAGDVWYEAPDWNMHEIRPVGKFVAGKGYSNSFGNFANDFNGDGWDDYLLIGFPGDPFHWYENPQNKPGHWKEHLVWHSACNESPEFEDLDGDGRPEIILGSQPESKMGFLRIPTGEKVYEKWNFRAISRAGDPSKNGTFKYYHGLGIGDFSGDGRQDVLIPHGWWEAPAEETQHAWEFHPFSLSKTPEGEPLKAANMYVEDLDLDGDPDIIMSSAHTYGVWWFENQSADGQPRFAYHLIDETYSQTHAMEYVDINGDGQRDIVTGKRFFAHNGSDPGGKDPVQMYWYEVQRTKGSPPKFIPHEIVAGRDTGTGTQFLMQDITGDGLYDVVLSNKKGVNVLVQQRE